MEEILQIVGGEIWFTNLRNTTILESRNSFKKGSCFEWQYRNDARAAATPPLGDPPLALLGHQHHLKGEGAVEQGCSWRLHPLQAGPWIPSCPSATFRWASSDQVHSMTMITTTMMFSMVRASWNLRSILGIDEDAQTISLDATIRFQWKDTRVLQHPPIILRKK